MVKKSISASENGTQPYKEGAPAQEHESFQEYKPMSLSVELHDREKIRNGKDAATFMVKVMPDPLKENFFGLYLDCRNQIVHAELVALGSLNASIVHPREVFKPAIVYSAASIVILHNHPSGDPSPSEADISVTRKLVETGRILGISVLDHVITGANGSFTSLVEEGFI